MKGSIFSKNTCSILTRKEKHPIDFYQVFLYAEDFNKNKS